VGEWQRAHSDARGSRTTTLTGYTPGPAQGSKRLLENGPRLLPASEAELLDGMPALGDLLDSKGDVSACEQSELSVGDASSVAD